MENKNLKEAGKVVLTDEELMEIVGGTGDSTSSVSGVERYCEGFNTREECDARYLCQWGQIKCHPHPRAYTVLNK